MHPRSIGGRCLVVGLALCCGLLGCTPRPTQGLRPDLIGVWKTEDPKYQDRFFQFEPQTLILGIGEERRTTYRIQSVGASLDRFGTLYTVAYWDPQEGMLATFAFYYDPVSGVIRLNNQDRIEWRKESS